jgi:hypothetical protein
MSMFVNNPKLKGANMSSCKIGSLSIKETDIYAFLEIYVGSSLCAFTTAFCHLPTDELVTVRFATQRNQIRLIKRKAKCHNRFFMISDAVQHF